MTATPVSGSLPLLVSFNGSASSDPDGAVVSYAWNFGDGATGSGATASHTYAAAGAFAARLTVTDDKGAASSATQTITVTDPNAPPAAPSGLSGSARNGTVTLRWTDNASSEDGFYIERAPSGGAFAQVGQASANATSWTQTAARATYQYRVRAFKGAGVSGYSNTVTVRVK